MKPSGTNTLLFHLALLCTLLVFYSCYREDNEPKPYNYIINGPEDLYPAFSPCGEYIAYWHFAWEIPEPTDYPTGLYIIDRDGANRRLILKGHHYTPSWSPCGQWLVFSSGGVIQKCKTDGEGLTTFDGLDHLPAPEFYFPHWSKDGKYILFDKPLVSEMGIYYMTPDFQNVDNIITSGRDPELSPDGSEFIYYGWVNNFETSEIFKRDINGLHKERLTHNEKSNQSPTWSPDGQHIAWSSSIRLCIMNADGTSQRQIDYGNNPSWSVNDEIVFSHANHDYSKEVLYIISPDGLNKRQITF